MPALGLTAHRGLRTLAGQALVAFGLLSAVVQLYTAVWGSDALTWRWQTVALVLAASIGYAAPAFFSQAENGSPVMRSYASR